MMTIAAVMAGVSVWLFLRRPGGARLRLLTVPHEQRVPTAGRTRSMVQAIGAAMIILVFLVGAGVTVGGVGVVIGLAATMLVATILRLVRLQQRSRRARQARSEIAHACSVLASQCRVGAVPTVALQRAAEDCPILKEAAAAQRIGGDVVTTWLRSADRPGCVGLSDLARAWEVSRTTGAELAGALSQVARALDGDQALARVVGAELAAPRATGRMLGMLPLVGLALGYLIGGDPLAFLLDSIYGWACLLLGTMLACGGVLWIERLSHRTQERF